MIKNSHRDTEDAEGRPFGLEDAELVENTEIYSHENRQSNKSCGSVMSKVWIFINIHLLCVSAFSV